MKTNNKKTRTRRFVFSIFYIAVIGFFGTAAVQDIVESFQLKAQLSNAKNELNELNTKKEGLAVEKLKLEDNSYVENYARGHHLLSKDDEQVFVLPKGK